MKQPIYALVDCNNFFVSCERLFRPELEGKPVVVLSSNDGCAVARSNEAKALGIPMGAPAFKYRQLFQQHRVVSFSANFELYGDISRRVTDVLTTVTPNIEIYSVDESFLDLSELPISNYEVWGKAVKAAIWKWVGIPVSIGIGPSKTLAKAATHLAKKDPAYGGAYSFVDHPFARTDLAKIPIGDVWGVGWRLAPKLRAESVFTAADLAALRPQRAQQLMGIHGRQLVAELNGTACHQLQLQSKPAQSIARTRTFGKDTNHFGSLEAAISSFATQAAFRLRRSGQVTHRASLFLTTSRHKPNYQYWSTEVAYPTPTADTGQLISTLITALGELYDPTHAYHRAGVMLYDFTPDTALQTDLFSMVVPWKWEGGKRRMEAMDELNEKFGKRTVHFASEDLGRGWEPKHQLRSPRYVSNWAELPHITPI